MIGLKIYQNKKNYKSGLACCFLESAARQDKLIISF